MATIRRIPATFTSEAELITQVDMVMGTHFHIEREVPAQTPDGRRVRLDAVYRPRDPIGWRDSEPMFAVEYKQPPSSFDTRDYTRWIAQAVSYTYAPVNDRRLAVFTCPSPITPLTTGTIYGPESGRLVARILGQLRIGELTPLEHRGWSLLLNEHVIWSERNGVEEGSRWSLTPRSGSR